jgi:hypothetical protein
MPGTGQPGRIFAGWDIDYALELGIQYEELEDILSLEK